LIIVLFGYFFSATKESNMYVYGPAVKLLHCFNQPKIDSRLKSEKLIEKAKDKLPANRQW